MQESEETYFNIKIDKASIGEYAKEINDDLLLEYSKEKLRLVAAKGNKELSLPSPWLFKQITGVDLKYSPLGLHRIVLEVKTKRQRETTKKLTEDSFMVLFFKSSEITKVEEMLKEHKLESLSRDGIADFLLSPPFTYSYSVSLRKGMNLLTKASRIFVTLCFAYSILKWFFYCNSADYKPGEECTTYLSALHQLLLQMLQFSFSYFLSPLISTFDQLISPLPWIKYVILSVMSIIFLPFWSLLAIWGLIIYLADFVIRFHILFYVWDAFSLAVSNFKYLSSISKTIVTFTSYVWNSVRSLVKTKEKQS